MVTVAVAGFERLRLKRLKRQSWRLLLGVGAGEDSIQDLPPEARRSAPRARGMIELPPAPAGGKIGGIGPRNVDVGGAECGCGAVASRPPRRHAHLRRRRGGAR